MNDNKSKNFGAWTMAYVIFGIVGALLLWLVLSAFATFINLHLTSITASAGGRWLLLVLWLLLLLGTKSAKVGDQ